jgi:hypothetical protein
MQNVANTVRDRAKTVLQRIGDVIKAEFLTKNGGFLLDGVFQKSQSASNTGGMVVATSNFIFTVIATEVQSIERGDKLIFDKKNYSVVFKQTDDFNVLCKLTLKREKDV